MVTIIPTQPMLACTTLTNKLDDDFVYLIIDADTLVIKLVVTEAHERVAGIGLGTQVARTEAQPMGSTAFVAPPMTSETKVLSRLEQLSR
jgi:hypothetical protein